MKASVNLDQIGLSEAVLWHLASIQADVYQNQVLLAELLARIKDCPAVEVQNQWKDATEKLRGDRYAAALKMAGIDHASSPKPEEIFDPPYWAIHD